RPPQLHLIISTRVDPPLPLARLRVQRELAEVRAGDLRFNDAEAARFFDEVMGLDLNAADVASLGSRTEGWIAGLQLAALSLQGREDAHTFLENFSGSHRFILDYLVEEVVSRQTPAVRRFLLATSILERLNGSLCEAVTDQIDAQEMLQRLETANLFLIPLDDRRHWYRYHHLFADLLRARLQQTATEEAVAELHRRASRWYEAEGAPVEAVEHMLASGDVEQAADLIQRHGHAQWGLSNTTFMRFISHLPPQMLSRRPVLGVYHAWMLIIYGQIPAARQLLQELADRLDEGAGSPELEGVRTFIELMLAYTSVLLGAPPPQEVLDAAALALVSDDHLGMRNSADVVYAYLLFVRGELDAAADHLMVPIERDVAAQGTTAIPIAISRLAEIRQLQGRLGEVERLCRYYAPQVAKRGKERFYIAGNIDLVLGNVLRERNELQAAEELIQTGLETNEPWQVPHAQATGALVLARLQQAQGQARPALETLVTLEAEIAGRIILPLQRSELEALKVWLWLQNDEQLAALNWAAKLDPLPPPNLIREPELLTLVRVWLATDRSSAALALLGRLAEAAEEGGRAGRLLQIRVVQAQALATFERRGEALAALAAALRLATPEGYVRVFADEGAPIRDLLIAYLRTPESQHAAYARHLLRAFPDNVADAALTAGGMMEPLTPRELEVLQLICDGHSNQAIADRLTITVSTVKKHAGNIYGKLGVSSRAQAMVSARELGLVPPVRPTQ
ncbi:MAG TPA: LuxR C-terminal-related transcriptional regulator, partial [Candidatus Sulfomarinibacteraceae bacterium]|nr:LuxR C-terminal-related transcriptional regulator [Candidatus Sulfomarinibacteraceae bacterium]